MRIFDTSVQKLKYLVLKALIKTNTNIVTITST